MPLDTFLLQPLSQLVRGIGRQQGSQGMGGRVDHADLVARAGEVLREFTTDQPGSQDGDMPDLLIEPVAQ
ncbi:MAG: hypothetical protein P8101_15355, partial [Candidatus Thiodiazotropha sp.]